MKLPRVASILIKAAPAGRRAICQPDAYWRLTATSLSRQIQRQDKHRVEG